MSYFKSNIEHVCLLLCTSICFAQEPLVFQERGGADYVIETNPQYVEPGYFYGSQYFLDRVELTSGKKPSIETRLGDGYFECGLIRKQLQAMAGRTILRDGCDEAEQYRRLYENALAEAEALELRPGVRLSKEQVASLRRDMIWLEEQSLEGTRVLVPRVYLTESTLKGLSMSSANLIAAQIDLKSGELRNRGLIAAESMKLQADGSIVNVAGKLLSSGEMSLLAGQNLINYSGEIVSGGTLRLAGKQIASLRSKQRYADARSHTDVLGARAKIAAAGDLTLLAEEQISAQGASIEGRSIDLRSGGGISLDVAETSYHFKDGGGRSDWWLADEHGAHADPTRLQASGVIDVKAKDDLYTRALQLKAVGDVTFRSEAGATCFDSYKEYDYSHHASHTSGEFFGGSSTLSLTSYKEKLLSGELRGGADGTLKAEEALTLRATQVDVPGKLSLASTHGQIRLEAEKVRDYYQRQEESSGWLVSESSDEGHDRTTVQPVRLAAHELELSSPARIELKNGERQPWMEALKARKDIDWARVDENARAWANYDWSLSGPARALLSIALTVATAGTGATLAESHLGLASGTALNRGVGSALDGLIAHSGVCLANHRGDLGKTIGELCSSSTVKSILSSALTEGLVGSTSGLAFDQTVVKVAEKTAIQSSIQGGSVGKNFLGNAVDVASAQVAHMIGSAHAEGKLNALSHKAAHATLGAASAKLTGGDPLSGAVGAVTAEVAAEVLDKPDKELGKTAQQARLVTATTAFLSGLDVSSADAAGTNAVENNFLAHPELHVMRQRIAEDQSLAESEKQTKLAEVDQLAQQLYQAEGTGAMLAASTAAGMVFPTTAAVVGTGLSAQYYGSITANSGFAGLKQEAKAHPVLTTLAVAPFVPGPKGLGILKPGKPSFKVLKEIPKSGPASQFNSNIFSREVEWTAPTGTKQTYKVVQRNDIDWNKIRTKGSDKYIGRTNLEAAKAGYAPELADGNFVNLHHLGQDSRGPLVEASTKSHKPILHKQFGYGNLNPEFPVNHGAQWRQDTKQYWKDMAKEVQNEK